MLLLSSYICFSFMGALLHARPLPQNLAGGLDKLVTSNLITKAHVSAKSANAAGRYNGYATQEAADYADRAIQDPATKRFLVDIHPSGRVPLGELINKLQVNFASFTITATDTKYKGVGVVEGFISLEDVPALGNMHEVRSIQLGLKPDLNRRVSSGGGIQPGTTLTLLGTTVDQGVTQHRVDQINTFYYPPATLDLEGSGISIGVLSDSFGNPAADVANFDLPGAAGNPVNTQPVVVLKDLNRGTDEGRAMLQVCYKMAPKARLGYATGIRGSVFFAHNIRALAGLPGYIYPPHIQQGFAADVICDDILYPDEPYFEDGIIADAVDDVYAAGVSYFAAAGNEIGTAGYDSDFRYVPAGPGALANTNIDLAGVPTDLYQGGFHNFNPNPGHQDVAQTVNVLRNSSNPSTNLQWDDPYNQVLFFNEPPIYRNRGSIGGMTTKVVFRDLPDLRAGQNYVMTEMATSGDFDGIVAIADSSGEVYLMQDFGFDETVNFFPPVTGHYLVRITAYGQTAGSFDFKVYTGNNPQLTTDFNLLVFDMAGNYLPDSSLTTNNYATNIPMELGQTNHKIGERQVQYVIARSTIPTAPSPATHIRWHMVGNIISGVGPAEYFSYSTPNIKGHAVANGCNGTAAYSVFRQSIPEFYTSPGPATIYFDKMGNRLPTPEVRQQPRVAAADGANISPDLVSYDTDSDEDQLPNFYGTSAAAPHAAAIAALVLEQHGGTRSVTPAQMTKVLQDSTFPHDLDPNSASGMAETSDGGTVAITVNCDVGLNPSTGVNDPNSMSVAYAGPGSLTSLTFNRDGTAATAGNTTGGNNGLDLTNTYFSNVYPGLVFEPHHKAFTMGDSLGLGTGDVTATFSNQAPLPSVAGQWWTMTLTFPNANFTTGKVLRFTVGHGSQHNSNLFGLIPGPGPTGGITETFDVMADLFGVALLIPDGVATASGMTFSGTTAAGGSFSGTIGNQIGSGYSNQDGFGFLNAESAVKTPIR